MPAPVVVMNILQEPLPSLVNPVAQRGTADIPPSRTPPFKRTPPTRRMMRPYTGAAGSSASGVYVMTIIPCAPLPPTPW